MRQEGEPSVDQILRSIKRVMAREPRPVRSDEPDVSDAPEDFTLPEPADAEEAHELIEVTASGAAGDPIAPDAPFAHGGMDEADELLLDEQAAQTDDLIEDEADGEAETLQGVHGEPSNARADEQPAPQDGIAGEDPRQSATAWQDTAQQETVPQHASQHEPAQPETTERESDQPAGAVPEGAQDDGRAPGALTSEGVATSMRQSLAALAMLAEPGAPLPTSAAGAASLDRLVREMLRPMLAQWLETNLPPIVEREVRAEITRITGGKAG